LHFSERKLKNKGAGAKWTTLTLLQSMLIQGKEVKIYHSLNLFTFKYTDAEKC
jgi:hypothetical protein